MQNRKNTANKKLTRKGNKKKKKKEKRKTSKHDNTRNIKPVQIKTNTNK